MSSNINRLLKMDILELMRTRRSVRKYKDKQVPFDNIVTILRAGMDAPSAGNLKSWKFIIVKDENKRKAIAEAAMQQYWMEVAPFHIVLAGEPEKMERFYGTRGKRLYLIQSIAASIQNMLLAAHHLGLGACWVGAFDEVALRTILNVPEHANIHAIVTIGYPDEFPEKPPTFRLEHMMTYERFWGRVEIHHMHIGWWSQHHKKNVDDVKKLYKKTKKKVKDKIDDLKSKKVEHPPTKEADKKDKD